MSTETLRLNPVAYRTVYRRLSVHAGPVYIMISVDANDLKIDHESVIAGGRGVRHVQSRDMQNECVTLGLTRCGHDVIASK
jgi:hypothetical protein